MTMKFLAKDNHICDFFTTRHLLLTSIVILILSTAESQHALILALGFYFLIPLPFQ